MLLRIEVNNGKGESLRRLLDSFAPRITYTVKRGWLFSTFTAEGEETYISRLSAAVDEWRDEEFRSDAW